MRKAELELPQLGLIAATRGMAGAGIGLLLAERLPVEQRRAVGWTLFAVGLLTTIPLVLLVKSRIEQKSESQTEAPSQRIPVTTGF